MRRELLRHKDTVEEAKEVVKRYTPYAYSVAFRLTGNQAAAWDLVQNTMLRVLKSYATYDPTYKMEQWLYRIVRNLFIDGIRAEKRRKQAPLENTTEDGRRSPADTLVDPSPTPEQTLDSQSRQNAVEQGMNLLPAEMRMAVALVDLQGCSYEEAAGILEIPASTLGVRVYRGRKLLKKHLRPLMEG